MTLRGTLIAAIVLLGLALALPAAADQNDPQLPDLFERLRETNDAAEADLLEIEIWSLWMKSEDAEVNRLMHEGVMRMGVGDYDGALSDFDAVVDRAPSFAEGWNKRATVRYLMGDFAGSMEDVDRTLALEPRHFGALSGLGLINVELGDDDAALDAFERTLAVHPNMASARANADELRKRIEGQSI